MDFIVVGSVAYDSLETPSGKRERILGGSAHYFSLAASFFAPPGLVGIVGEDFKKEHIALLEKHGIDLEGLEKTEGKTFHWKGHYLDDLNEAKTLSTELNVFEKFQPKLPESYKKAQTVFLANIDPSLQAEVVRQVENPVHIASDTMNFWITGKSAELKKTLKMVNTLFINDNESKMLSGEEYILKAGKKIMEMGPSTIIIKRGEFGSVLMQGENIFMVPAFPLKDVVDPTGAGDSFAGGFISYLHATGNYTFENMKTALAIGTVMASFNVQDFSSERLTALTYTDIVNRYRKLLEYTNLKAVDITALKSS